MTDTIKIIKTKADHEEALERLRQLMDLNPQSATDEAFELDALAALIHTYETQQGFFKTASHEQPAPLEIILFKMAQNGLTAKDMQPYLGSPSKVSEVLSGKRPLSLNMIKRLSKGLNIEPRLLLDI